MRTRRTRAAAAALTGRLVAAAALTGIGLAAAAAPRPQGFRAGVDLVRLPVVVTGRDGVFVRGLSAGDFDVAEDGVPQRIVAFAEGAPGADVPLHLGLMLDVSESMDADLRDAANAAVRFVGALDEAADVTFLDFNASVRLTRFGPDDYPRLFARMRRPTATGQTAFYDAIGAYLDSARARGGQHVLVAYTDGGDNISRMTLPQLVDALRFNQVVLYVIGYLDNQSSAVRLTQEARLGALARETGGEAFFPASVGELQARYTRIVEEVGSRYTIGYESTNAKADGRFRKVRVRLTRPDLRSAKIRTRPGYLAPASR